MPSYLLVDWCFILPKPMYLRSGTILSVEKLSDSFGSALPLLACCCDCGGDCASVSTLTLLVSVMSSLKVLEILG